MRVHFLNEQYQQGLVAHNKVGTVDRLADVFTEALPRDGLHKVPRVDGNLRCTGLKDGGISPRLWSTSLSNRD